MDVSSDVSVIRRIGSNSREPGIKIIKGGVWGDYGGVA
jgi:hypothetical protein